MANFAELPGIPTLPASWLTIGNFDGVHRGHQQIIRTLVDAALAEGVPSVALTFDPHPATVLAGVNIPRITTLEEKTTLLKEMGIDHVVVLPFTRKVAALDAADFMNTLHSKLHFQHIVTGFDFALGRGRAGTNEVLRGLGEKMGYAQTLVPALEVDGSVVSSTNIRNAILAGAFGSVTTWLGRAYDLRGPVVHGDGRGRTINIPTSSVQFPHEKVTPAPGVYACVVQVADQTHYAVANLGFRPTFTQGVVEPRLEAHILDFNQDVYGQQMSVQFIQRVRPEVKFASAQELIAQINKDILVTRGIFELRD